MLRSSRLLPVLLALVCSPPLGLPSALVRERSAPTDVPIATEDALRLGSATFDREGAHVSGFSMAVRAIARGEARTESMRSAPSASGPEVRYARAPGVTEWWRSLASGLEHGVTLTERPAGDGPLVLEVDLGDAEVEADGPDALAIHGPHGRARYAGLLVVDAAGARIPARLEPAVGGARIVVDDEAAQYPLLVDPLFVSVPEDQFPHPGDVSCLPLRLGAAVAMSADGAWAIIGAPSMPVCGGTFVSGVGGALVYERAGTGWTFRAELRGFGGEGDGGGRAVAIDDAGDRAALLGAAHVTVHGRTSTTWARRQFLDVPSSCTSIAMSADGARIAVGCPGTVLLFEDTTGVYAPRTLPSVMADMTPTVVLSADGRRLLVTNSMASTAYVYRERGTWALDTGGDLGAITSVSLLGAAGTLSRNGLHVLLSSNATGAGNAHAFRFDGTRWVADGTLTGTGIDADEFGASLAISDDGARAAVGAPMAELTGIVRLFGRDGTGWRADVSLFQPVAVPADFGRAIALSVDGDRILVGEPGVPTAEVFRIADAAPNGGTCAASRDCLSGHCIDGMCCDADCDESGSSCESCRNAETGRPDGTCAPRTAATICRASTGPCDVAEVCDGVVRACPAAALAASGTTCRPSMGDCDPAEVCDGTRAVCPGDVLSPMGAVCGTSATSCSSPGMCDGSRPTCGGTGAPRPLGTICGPADASNPCDVDDVCDGEGVCVPQHAPATTPCGIITPDGPCDGPDHCDGMAPSCVRGRLAGVECRAAAGTCDVAEVCAGVSGDCPPDGLLAAGVTCRDSLAACDPVESCDGSATCPADVNMCLPDAGEDPDGGVEALDGGDADVPSADAGPPAPVAGCACHVAVGGRGPSSLLALIALTWLLARRR